jgi:hypothetical protein
MFECLSNVKIFVEPPLEPQRGAGPWVDGHFRVSSDPLPGEANVRQLMLDDNTTYYIVNHIVRKVCI